MKTTQRIESFCLWTWRKELKALFKMTRRIEPSRKNCSKTWTFFFWTWLKESNPFFECDSKIEFFWLKNSQHIELFPKNYDSKNWIFLKMMQRVYFWKKNLIRRMEPSWKYHFQTKTWLKELNFSSNMARRIELFLFSMSQRMGVFLVWLKELNFLIWVKDFNPFFKYAKSYTLFLSIRRKELNPFLWIWRKEMNTFFFHLTQRIETFDQEIWLKELSRVSKKDSKNGTLYKGLIELNLFLWTSSQYDSKSWSLFFNMTRRIEPFFVFQYDSKNWFFQNAQGIEPLFHMNYFFTWLELNFFWSIRLKE